MSFKEDRMNVTHMGAMEHLTIDDISDEALVQANHMHFSSIFLQPGMKDGIITLFKRVYKIKSFDPSLGVSVILEGVFTNLR